MSGHLIQGNSMYQGREPEKMIPEPGSLVSYSRIHLFSTGLHGLIEQKLTARGLESQTLGLHFNSAQDLG